MSVYHKNGILTGYVDHYCLVCESHLKSEDDINGHIAKPIHKKNLDAAGYVEKFINDCVRKVKKGYYCEFCNALLSTAAKVNLHVAEQKHYANKGSTLLRRHGSSIVAFLDVLIGEKAWNGLIEETCATCNTEFDDEQIHKTEITHILSLVQCKVEFGAGKAVYRKIDDSSFQCLTCNRVLALSDLDNHFDLSEHKEMIIPFVDKEQVKEPPKEKTKEIKAKTEKPFELKFHFGDPPKKNANKVDATTKGDKNETKVSETKNTEPKKAEIKNSEVLRNIKPEPKHDLDEEICKALGGTAFVATAEAGLTWCLLCDWSLPDSALPQHLRSKHHEVMLKLKKERIAKKIKAGSIILEAKPEPVVVKKTVVVESVAEVENKAKILDNVTKFTNGGVNINFESKKSVCKKCTKYINFDYDAIENHIEEHKKEQKLAAKKEKEANEQAKAKENEAKKAAIKTVTKSEITKKPNKNEITSETEPVKPNSAAKGDKEAEKYAKANGLIHNDGAEKVYCKTCEKRLPFCLKNMKEHVTGLLHRKRAMAMIVKVPFGEFMRSATGVEIGTVVDYVIINDKYCLSIYSFMLFMKLPEGLHCAGCDVHFGYPELGTHEYLPPHLKAMCEAKVISSMETEFLREVRPNVIHCGFCNAVADACDLTAHLDSTTHRESKTRLMESDDEADDEKLPAAASWRLHQYSGDISQHPRKRQMETLQIMKTLVSNC